MLSFFIARKYFARSLTTKATATSLWLSLFAVFIGSLSLSLALSITHAFEEKVFNKLEGINAHAFVFSYGATLDANELKKKLLFQHGKIIRGMTIQSIHNVIINHNNQQIVISLRAVDPSTEQNVTNLAAKCCPPHTNTPLSTYFSGTQVIIGKALAKQLNLSVGDTLPLLIPHARKNNATIKLSEKTVTIGAIFSVGFEEFDNNTIFCTFPFFSEAFNTNKSSADTLLITFNDTTQNTSLMEKLSTYIRDSFPFMTTTHDEHIATLKKTLPNYTVSSWKELYPAIISAMHLEKCGIISVILLFMTVALMNIISVLFTLINRKQRDIALFQALGMPDPQISQIFLWLGMSMATASSFAGVGVGALLSFALETYQLIPLPEMYYVSYLPASTNPIIFIFVGLVSLTMSAITIIVGTRHVKNNDVLEILRQTS